MNGESSIVTSLRIGRPSRWTSNRSDAGARRTPPRRARRWRRTRGRTRRGSARRRCLQLLLLLVGQAVVAQRALDDVEQRLELDLAVPLGRELARVEVQVEAQDLVALGPQGGQLAQSLLGRHGRHHCGPGSRPDTPPWAARRAGAAQPTHRHAHDPRVAELVRIGGLAPDPSPEAVDDDARRWPRSGSGRPSGPARPCGAWRTCASARGRRPGGRSACRRRASGRRRSRPRKRHRLRRSSANRRSTAIDERAGTEDPDLRSLRPGHPCALVVEPHGP